MQDPSLGRIPRLCENFSHPFFRPNRFSLSLSFEQDLSLRRRPSGDDVDLPYFRVPRGAARQKLQVASATFAGRGFPPPVSLHVPQLRLFLFLPSAFPRLSRIVSSPPPAPPAPRAQERDIMRHQQRRWISSLHCVTRRMFFLRYAQRIREITPSSPGFFYCSPR